jgi:hypothetical protein
LASELDGGEGSASHAAPRNEKEKMQDLSILLPHAMSKTLLKDEMFHFQGREHIQFRSENWEEIGEGYEYKEGNDMNTNRQL